MGISAKGVDECIGHLGDRGGFIHKPLFFRVGDKAHLKEDGRASGLEQHPESSLAYTSISPIEMSDKALLDLLSHAQGLIHIAVLHQLEHDIGVNRVGVKALIGCLVIRLELHDRILPHGYVEVRFHSIGTEDESLHTPRFFFLRRVGMDRDEEVSVRFIGNVRTLLERDKDICRTGIYDVHIGILLIDLFSHRQYQLEVEVFLLGEFSHRARVFSAVSGVEDEGIGLLRHKGERQESCQQYMYNFSHSKPNYIKSAAKVLF